MYKNENKFVHLLETYLVDRLSGNDKEYEFIEGTRKPSNELIIGNLGDKDEEELHLVTTKTKTNSIRLKFLTKTNSSISIQVKFSLYYQAFPSYERFLTKIRNKILNTFELSNKPALSINNIIEFLENEEYGSLNLPVGWKRLDVTPQKIKFDISNSFSNAKPHFDDAIKQIKDDPYSTGSSFMMIKEDFTIPLSNIKTEEEYIDFIQSIKFDMPMLNWQLKVQCETRNYKKQNCDEITLTFLNDTLCDNSYETFMFNFNAHIDLKNNELCPYCFSYEYEGYNESYSNYLQTTNCDAKYDAELNTIQTRHYARFEQPSIIPKTDFTDLAGNSFSLKFEDLSDDSTIDRILDNLIDQMHSYLEFYKKQPQYQNDEKFTNYTTCFSVNFERIMDGVKLIKQNKIIRQSFQLLNETFKQASSYDSWRVFQLCFILMLIPDIVEKKSRRNITEVLHVQTGGGKSETYFGCVIFSAFFDRLTGKNFGLTAITKFPLRMLSIQQLQRIARIMIFADKVRRDYEIDGEPFSVGYFVGNNIDFPGDNCKLIKEIKNKQIKGKIIEICPFCKTNNVILSVSEEEMTIYHKCTDCKEKFNLFFIDNEIYRKIPTFIVSTVDKHSSISRNRRYRNLIGGKLDKCPKGHGLIPHGDKCSYVNEIVNDRKNKCNETGERVNIDFSTAPTLIIQDEMHLIKESFGTIDSHFESLIEVMQQEMSGYGIKNIAMTATISGANHQIKQLYNKQTNIFPSKSPFGMGDNDFFHELIEEHGNVKLQRIILGLRPNARDNQFACSLTLRHLANFYSDIENNRSEFCKKYGFNYSVLDKLLERYKSGLTYHNKKSDVHTMEYYLLDVVNSHLKKSVKVQGKPLTGDNSLDEIKELIEEIENANLSKQKDLIFTFATSVVSHGVDIGKWNIMEFQGIPRSTAEYIQSLSRVGRKNLGLVLLWFYGNRVRDVSFYHNFSNYHDILEHHVNSIPISRWAKLGVDQTFHSVFCASIINFFADKYNRPLYTVDAVNDLFKQDSVIEELIDFIKKAYHVNESNPKSHFLNDYIPREVEQRLKALKTRNFSRNSRYFFPIALDSLSKPLYRTQYGMRGIQDELIIKPSSDDKKFVEEYLKGENK